VADYETVAKLEDIEPGELACVKVGETELALARVDGEVYAVQGHCLHLQGPLCEGRLEGHMLSCPWHGWQYDVRTGLNEFDHAIQLRTFDVRVADGEIQVDV
jgi:nitrite reductase/ring-hydroxylating ferredoxin subunit